MDTSLLPLLSQMYICSMALSRLRDVSYRLDSSDFDSFYHDICSLKASIISLCDKYSKN